MPGVSLRADWVESIVRDMPSGIAALDVGFVGRYEQPLLHSELRRIRPDVRWIGLDIDADALRRHRVPDSVAGDAARIPFANGSFQAVLLLEVIEHLYEETRVLEEIHRVLSPDGALVLTTPSAWYWLGIVRSWLPGALDSRLDERVRAQYLGAHDHVRFFDPLSLMNELADHGFAPEVVATIDHRIPGLARLFHGMRSVSLSFWPFDRLGCYVCLRARRVPLSNGRQAR